MNEWDEIEKEVTEVHHHMRKNCRFVMFIVEKFAN